MYCVHLCTLTQIRSHKWRPLKTKKHIWRSCFWDTSRLEKKVLVEILFGSQVLITLMMGAASTSETSVLFYQTTWSNIPEDSHLHLKPLVVANDRNTTRRGNWRDCKWQRFWYCLYAQIKSFRITIRRQEGSLVSSDDSAKPEFSKAGRMHLSSSFRTMYW